jgi:hypothetical protein
VHAVLSLSRLSPNFIDVPFWAGCKSLLVWLASTTILYL